MLKNMKNYTLRVGIRSANNRLFSMWILSTNWVGKEVQFIVPRKKIYVYLCLQQFLMKRKKSCKNNTNRRRFTIWKYQSGSKQYVEYRRAQSICGPRFIENIIILWRWTNNRTIIWWSDLMEFSTSFKVSQSLCWGRVRKFNVPKMVRKVGKVIRLMLSRL